MRSASPFRVRLRSPAQGWVCRIRGVFPSLRERFGRWHLYRARGRKPTYSTKPTLCAGCRDLQVPASDARHPAQAKGVLPARIAMRGARAQHCATVWPGNKVCRVCGSHLAVWASGPKAQSLRACAGWRQRRRCEPWCVPGLQVCTRPHENGQGRKLNAGAGLRLIRRLDCRNRPTSEPDSVTLEKSVLAGACDP